MRSRWMIGVATAVLAAPWVASAQTPVSGGAADPAPDVQAPTATAPQPVSQEIVVFGAGQTRQIQTITHADIRELAPGTSPIKAVAKLPSVNFQAADPFGAYEWAERISIRGFAQNQLGYTLDDVPLGDMSYANDNGLHISRAITSENIGRTELAQGTGGLDTASTSNIGGTLRFFSIDPSHTFGVEAQATYGSEDTVRGLLRLETGDLPGGGRGYVSYSYLGADKWKGYGDQTQHQFNSKYVQPIGEHGRLTGFFNFSERHEHDYQDLSLALIKRDGYTLDNISNDYAKAVLISKVGSTTGYTGLGIDYGVTQYPAPYQTADDVYYDAAGNRRDFLGGARLDYDITDSLKFHATAYGHYNKGVGTWDTPYAATPNPAGGLPIVPLALRTTEYQIQREGVVSSLTYEIARNTIEASFWYEHNLFHQARRFYSLGADEPGREAAEFPDGDAFFTQWQYAFTTDTYVGSLQDTWRITDALKLNFGFKSVQVDNHAQTVNATSASLLINGDISTSEHFLPQVGVNYRLDRHNEFFADYAQNVRAFVSSHTDGPFSTTQAGFNAIQGSLKPETTDTFEGGYRLHYGPVEGVVAGYHVEFSNRLLATTVGAGIVGNPTALSNVGGVTSDGAEVAGTWRFAPAWSLFLSYSYNSSTYDDDTRDGTGALVAATKGKTTVDTPETTAKGELAYDDGAWFFHLGAYYISKRYYTYTNDASVPEYLIADLGLGYRIHGHGLLDGSEVQLNITNLSDQRYISTIGTNGFVNSDPTGAFQTLMVGSPREAFVTFRKHF